MKERNAIANRRLQPRYARSLSIAIDDPRQDVIACKSTVLDLSGEGLRFETSIPLPPGEKFTFDLRLPNGFPVAGLAECRWERATPGAPLRQYGAKILLLDPISERALNQYLATLADASALTYQAATTRSEREQAYRLVHDNYVRMGYMAPHPSGIRFTAYHTSPGAATFVAKQAGEVIATLTVFLGDEMGLPIEQIYGREVAELRRQGRKVAEFGALAHRRADIRRGLDVFLNLCRLAHAYTAANGVDDILITVNPRHRDLYPKLLRFKSFGGERNYPALADNPAVAYRLDLRQADPKSPEWAWFCDHPGYKAALTQAIEPISAEEADYFQSLSKTFAGTND